MLGFIITFANTAPISSIPIMTNTISNRDTPIKSYKLSDLNWNRKNRRGFKASFSEDKEEVSEKQKGNGEEEDKKGGERFNLRWSELVFDPDPDNLVAVGLTGILAWASVQVLWQLFAISFAILIAAVKYSFIAALLIFILITLL